VEQDLVDSYADLLSDDEDDDEPVGPPDTGSSDVGDR
jgi:hypothetical protein